MLVCNNNEQQRKFNNEQTGYQVDSYSEIREYIGAGSNHAPNEVLTFAVHLSKQNFAQFSR